MSIDFTTTALVNNLKRRVLIPSAQVLFSETELIAFMSDELNTYIVPKIKDAKKEFFVTYTDVPLVAGQIDYSIPERAFASALRDFSFVDSNGNEFVCPMLSPEILKDGYFAGPPVNQAYGAYFQGDKLKVFVGGANPTSIRLRWERRPNDLTTVSRCMTITAINTTTKEVTVSSVPGGTYGVGVTVDFINNRPPFQSKGDDYAITVMLANVLTFASLPSDLAVGNYIAPSGQSPVAQVPYDLHGAIAQLGAGMVLNAKGDDTGPSVYEKGEKMVAQFIQAISPRVEGSPEVITNRRGIFSQGRGYFWQ